MNRRAFVAGLGAVLAAPLAAEAQRRGKARRDDTVYRIGVLCGASSEWLAPLLDAFRGGLLGLGYGEKQLLFETRYASGQDDILPRLVDELVRLKVDVIVTASSTPATLAAKRGTTEIPIVMVGIGQPEAVVSNLGRPGGNITGSTILGAEAVPKRLELVRQLLPGAKRVALLWNPDNPANVLLEREVRRTAPKLDVSLISVTVRDRAQMDSAFGLIAKERAEALIVTGDPMHQLHIDRVITFAARNRVPAIYNIKENVLAGGLMSYGADHRELYRRAALYVDRIFKGALPSDLPIEQPTKFELVINLKTAKALGLTIPPSLLLRADQVIE
jgi:putative tryptophan/tyrosine transport system substrate-binding protein